MITTHPVSTDPAAVPIDELGESEALSTRDVAAWASQVVWHALAHQ